MVDPLKRSNPQFAKCRAKSERAVRIRENECRRFRGMGTIVAGDCRSGNGREWHIIL